MFLKYKLIAVGSATSKLVDLRRYKTLAEFSQALSNAYPDMTPDEVRVRAGALYRFAWEVHKHDLVVYSPKAEDNSKRETVVDPSGGMAELPIVS
jgi:predicted Mrr-cat superfamily restriction endonuclease